MPGTAVGDPIRQQLDSLRIDRTAARPGRSWTWLVAAVAVLATLGALAAWWARARGVATVRAVAVRAETAAGGAAVLNASGYVTARRRATVSSEITGRVVEVRIEEGDRVAAGDVVARLDAARPQADLALAESRLEAARRAMRETRSQLELAELTLGRTSRLAAADVAGQAELDRASAEAATLRARLALQEQQVGVAEQELAVRRVDLSYTVIRAPFDGVVISKDAQPGEMVSPISAGGGFTRTGICTIVDMDSLEIEVEVNESYISRVRPEQTVEAVLDAYPDWPIPSRVITTIPAADRQKATVLVRVGFERLDPRILPDMGVRVTFLEAASPERPARPRLFVPRAALRRSQGADALFVLRDGRVERRAVSVGASAGDEVEVVSGVSPGERVVVEGPEELADGARVRESGGEAQGGES
jgi:RND family efflux transporter MFP subunit